MQGKLTLGIILVLAVTPTAAIAGETKRQVCSKTEQQQTVQQRQQPRVREPECRTRRPIPPVVDPTPVFLI
jgi:hypothetical protein